MATGGLQGDYCDATPTNTSNARARFLETSCARKLLKAMGRATDVANLNSDYKAAVGA